jgi:two-component system response regulator PhcR
MNHPAASPPPAVAHSGVTVLYVDDEVLARRYFEHALRNEHTVLAAASVDEAIAVLANPEHRIGVLVTDYRMPRRMGGELLRHVEQHYPHIVRILVTAHADKQVLLESVNCGELFRVMEKPIDLDELREAVRGAGVRARERSARRQSLHAIEETLAFLAHELTTPLAAISNFARGIGRRMDAPDADRLQAEIGSAASLMHDNARYCLAVLDSFAGSVRLANAAAPAVAACSRASAAQLIAALLDAYPLTAAQRAMIVVEVQHDFAVTALPNCVALVLSSILSNALRALAGHADAALHFGVRVGAVPQIVLRDNGPGIEAPVLARLLVDPVTMHRDSGGNGWGLIFCQRIMQSFGGSIAIESEPGRSTTIALNFPEPKKRSET